MRDPIKPIGTAGSLGCSTGSSRESNPILLIFLIRIGEKEVIGNECLQGELE